MKCLGSGGVGANAPARGLRLPRRPGSPILPACRALIRLPARRQLLARPCQAAAEEFLRPVDPPGSDAETEQPSTSGSDSRSNSSSSRPLLRGASPPSMPKEMMAAMALSPLAALSLPLVQNQAWRESMRDFRDKVRYRLQGALQTDAFQAWWESVDHNLTFMDWTWHWTGIDFSYVWDPELWSRFKQAVAMDDPALFWNKLWDRIEYRRILPQAGMAGDMRMSYAKFLQLLETNRIKRIQVYGDMKTAIVEVPHPWYASIMGAPGAYPFVPGPDGSPANLMIPNPAAPNDPSQWFCPEMAEWNMEKYRFYLDLPGDFWDSGHLLGYLRSKQVKIHWDADSKQYILPYEHFTKVLEVRTELQVMDPTDSWDFLGWLLQDSKMEFYEKCAAVCLFIRGVAIALNLISATALFKLWRKKKKSKKSKEQNMWEKLTAHTAREFMSKDKTGKARDTGVRFADIAGMDYLVQEMREVVRLLLGDPVYARVGAKCPRGIIFQGPPGTGKTYLARAIAGEAGVTFLSAVGSEFVEMFAGVAAARVNSLYYAARKKSPCIIFIDEIDAIGRSRSALGNDPGSMERESALLSLLVQMDGIHGKLEQVLTIGATNLAPELDQALLRPGRFEVVYEIPPPGPVGRMEILKYHSRGKPMEEGDLLVKVAEVTHGWSAAALANLMNEAAIMTVRKSVPKITLPLVMDLIDHSNWGSIAPKLPPTEAKNRLALLTAAKAVAFALTPGIDVIKFVTLWSKRQGQGPYVEFIESQDQLDPNWHPEEIEIMGFKSNYKVNAAVVGEKLGEFVHVSGLLQPLYAPRAAELMLFGPDGVSLATALPISDCFEIAYYCVRNSTLHPRFSRFPPLHTYMWLGNDHRWAQQRDPLALGLDEELGYHKLTVTLLKASWRRAQRMVAQRRTAIKLLAEELLAADDEKVSGERVVELLETTALDDASDIVVESDFLPILRQVLGNVPSVVLEGAQAADVEDQLQPTPARQPVTGPATAAFRSSGAGGSGAATFTRWPSPSDGLQPELQPVVGPAEAGFATSGGVGNVVFTRTGGPSGPGTAKVLALDDATLVTVSKAIMGRLDIVDLVGRNTAFEIAERVRDSLLHPETVERLKAVRAYVDATPGAPAPFPPPPLGKDVPLPLYGKVSGSLSWWKQRRTNVVTWDAISMLYTERQLKYYREDSDIPRYEDTSQGRKAAAAEAAAAAGASANAPPVPEATAGES